MTTDPRNLSRGTAAALEGWIDGAVHIYPLRVQYEDTDAGGIIYHSNYVSFAERGRSACLRCLGIRQEDALAALQQGDREAVMLVVRRVEADFLMTAGLGAELRVETALLKLGGASMKLQQTIRHVEEGMKIENGHILARLLVDIVCVAASKDGGKRPRRIPSAVVDRLRAATPPDPASG